MFPPESAPLLYQELTKIATLSERPAAERVLALASLMERIFYEATRREQIVFSSLFARISYAGHLFHFQPDILQRIHRFRLLAKHLRNGREVNEKSVQLGVQAIAETVLVLTGAAIPVAVLAHFDQDEMLRQAQEAEPAAHWVKTARVLAIDDAPEHNCLIVIDEEHAERSVSMRYGIPERNENFNATIQVIRKVFGFPVTLQLIDVDIDHHGRYCPRAIVVEPDYLVDVSAISECFRDTGADPYTFLVRKFLPYENTEAKLLGNIANFFLDRLLSEPAAEWSAVFRETFQLYPFVYAPMSDNEVKSVSGKAQKHFLTLKSMALGGFERQGIEPAHCFLEPSFFSEQYGIQGRLDLFYKTDEQAAIVELKSGTPFKPNSYGIARSHFTQTLLYDLLVRSVFGQHTDPAKYILYSGVDLNHLRFAPTVVPEQWEALQVRNQLVALERLLTKILPGDATVPVFGKLKAANGKGFTERDYGMFESAYSHLSLQEKKYFNAFTGFIAREHWLAKTGDEAADNAYGHAALWRSSFGEKQQQFGILSHLEIVENRADQPDPCIIFHKTEHTNPLANFRVGDIAVLYPALDDTDTVLQHQVIKCTISELSSTHVTVQLRYRQFNLISFQTEGYWRLEPDLMDTGFAAQYRGLLEWAATSTQRRALLMGMAPPRMPETAPNTDNSILDAIKHSRDYFLLWGPPGTGKTSVMLRDLAAWVLNDTSDNLLLLAYTNRAVDEICDALDAIGGNIRDQYIRIGSRHATAERFREQLLSVRIAPATTRAELRAILENRRVFVSTVASFGQNDGLLRLKKFQRLIVDEASQILEPQLIGLLTRFEHTILIGDHRQLPAITVQRPENTLVEDADLQSVGIQDLRESYFERLYRRCLHQGWHWAYGQLNRQGRMHADIMDFPNRFFYDGLLKTLTDASDSEHRQHRPLWYDLPGADALLEKICAEKRVVFFPVESDEVSSNAKTSRSEAAMAARIVLFFKRLYELNNKPWEPVQTLGIITPWRAQIAQIRASLSEAGIDPDCVTIDTVERYQGGAREIIVVSTCVHSEHQLSSLVSIGEGGIDRKFNVALTRAREHLIVLGNAAILQMDERYRAFMGSYEL